MWKDLIDAMDKSITTNSQMKYSLFVIGELNFTIYWCLLVIVCLSNG